MKGNPNLWRAILTLSSNQCKNSRLRHTTHSQNTTLSTTHTPLTATSLVPNYSTDKYNTAYNAVCITQPALSCLNHCRSDTRIIKLQRFRRSTHSFLSFSHIAFSLSLRFWRNVPNAIRHSATLFSFKNKLVSWCFEPSQPQRVIPELFKIKLKTFVLSEYFNCHVLHPKQLDWLPVTAQFLPQGK